MHRTNRTVWMALVVVALIAVMAVAACAPAGGVPSNVQSTVAAVATQAAPAAATVQAAATNIAPTIQAAATTIAPTVQAAATNIAPTVAAVATQAAGGSSSGGSKDTLVWVKNIDDIVSFDPAAAYEYSDLLAVHAIYDTLVKFEGSDLTTIKPALATKWDIKDAGDHNEITFTLQDGIKFASGNPLTSADVVYTFQRATQLQKPPDFLFTDIAKLKPDSISAPDAKTVVFKLPKDASPGAFLAILAGPNSGIIDSKEAMAHATGNDFGNGWLTDHSAGSGPYQLDHWTKDVEWLIKANPNAAVQPKTPQILVKHVPEAANQQALLEKGDADIAHDLTPEQVKALAGNSDVKTEKDGNLQIFYVGMNATMAPLDKPEVRQALRYAIDYDGIANDLLSGNAQVNQAIIPIGFLGDHKDPIFKQDVAKAKDLLKQAGVPDGFTIDVLALTGNQGLVPMGDLAAKLQSDWADIGVKVNIKQQAAAELLGTYRASKAPMVLLLWGPDFADPDTNATPFSDYNAGSIAKRNNWKDQKAADMAKAAALETDPTKRAAMYKDLNEYVANNGPYAVLFQPAQLFGLRSNVQGFSWSPMGYSDLWNISKQ